MKFLKNKKFLIGLLVVIISSAIIIIGIYFYLNQSLSKIKLPEVEKEEELKTGFSHMSPEQIEQILESMTPKSTTSAE